MERSDRNSHDCLVVSRGDDASPDRSASIVYVGGALHFFGCLFILFCDQYRRAGLANQTSRYRSAVSSYLLPAADADLLFDVLVSGIQHGDLQAEDGCVHRLAGGSRHRSLYLAAKSSEDFGSLVVPLSTKNLCPEDRVQRFSILKFGL